MSRRGFLAEITVEGWVAILSGGGTALAAGWAGALKLLEWLRRRRQDALAQMQEIVLDLRRRHDELERRYEDKLSRSEEAHEECRKDNLKLGRRLAQVQAENHAQQLQMKDLADSREAFRREQQLLHDQQAEMQATISEMRQRLAATIETLTQRLQQAGEKP
jgi:chromosome segregation ATPase